MNKGRIKSGEQIMLAFKTLKPKWKRLAAASLLASILELFYFAWYATPWNKMGVAEWAYWVGAVGTIGTLIGTITLATSESRKRKNQSLSKARIYVAKMQFPMMQTAINIINIAKRLEDDQVRIRNGVITIEDMYQNWKKLGDEISSMQYWTSDELVALLALSETNAELIAGFQSQILLVGHQIAQGRKSGKTVYELMEDIEMKISILRRAANSLHIIGNKLTNDSIAEFTLKIT